MRHRITKTPRRGAKSENDNERNLQLAFLFYSIMEEAERELNLGTTSPEASEMLLRLLGELLPSAEDWLDRPDLLRTFSLACARGYLNPEPLAQDTPATVIDLAAWRLAHEHQDSKGVG
jgi:hypothetical protein